MDYSKYIVSAGMTMALFMVYQKYKSMDEEDDEFKNYNIVKRYLVSGSSLAKSKLPILWIYMEYPQNSRWWESFYSRNSNDLNQPYLYLTIKSIIDKCGGHFNICLIDDDTIMNIVPGWSIDIHKAAEPIRDKLRDLAKAYILKYYGGMFIPPSFLCLKNLANMYYSRTSGGKMFIGELQNENITSTFNSVCVSRKLIGAHKNNSTIDNYIQYLQYIISSDYTAESKFEGDADRWLYGKTQDGEINIIHAKHLGAKDSADKDVIIDNLLGNSFIDFDPAAVGIYFPQSQLLNRTTYLWFVRLSAQQAMESDTIIGKLLLTNCSH